MTATNHMLTGAVIAVGVQRPWFALPLAFLSHFILDILPHFGVMESDTPERNGHPLFRSVLVADVALAVALLITLPLALNQVVSWWIVLLSMIVAWIPDMVWLSHFWHDRKGHARTEPLWLTRFHQKIQWFEKPPGIITELVWLGGMGVLLRLFGI